MSGWLYGQSMVRRIINPNCPGDAIADLFSVSRQGGGLVLMMSGHAAAQKQINSMSKTPLLLFLAGVVSTAPLTHQTTPASSVFVSHRPDLCYWEGILIIIFQNYCTASIGWHAGFDLFGNVKTTFPSRLWISPSSRTTRISPKNLRQTSTFAVPACESRLEPPDWLDQSATSAKHM
jgi:hypothetical protein